MSECDWQYDLTINALSSQLGDLSSHWREMGLHLRLKKEVLDEIEQDLSKSCYRCMIEMFDRWLLHGENCTWSTIKAVLHKMEKNARAKSMDHYIAELQRIQRKQQKFNKHCRKLVPMPDYCYEDWCLERLHFENDRLNHYPDPTLGDWLERPPKFLTDIAAQWYRIGIGLNLPKSLLDKIDRDCKGGCDQKFQEVMEIWQERDFEHSWRKLIDILQKLDLGKFAEFMEDEAWKEIRDAGKVEHSNSRKHERGFFRSRIDQEKFEQNQRYDSLVKLIRTIVLPPSDISSEDFMTDIKRHIQDKKDLTLTEMEQIIDIIERIEEIPAKYTRRLRILAIKLRDDLNYSQEVRSRLIKIDQKLEEEKSTLEREKAKVYDEIKKAPGKASSMEMKFDEQMHKIEEKLETVRKSISICIEMFEYAISDYDVINDILNTCFMELMECRKELEGCENLSKACKMREERLWEAPLFMATTASGAILGAGGPVVLGAIVGSLFGSLGMVFGLVAGALISLVCAPLGAVLGRRFSDEVTSEGQQSILVDCDEVLHASSAEISKTNQLISELKNELVAKHHSYHCK